MNNVPCNFVSLKRKAEEPDLGLVKNGCLEKTFLFKLPEDVVNKIFNLLSNGNLLVIDATAKECSALTKMQWRKRQKARFSFSTYEKDNNLLIQALDCYVNERVKIKVEEDVQEKVKAVYQRFEGLMTCFPIFGAYIWYDLTQSFPPFTISPKNQKLFGDHLGYLKDNPMLEPQGGDYLLKGLYQITQKKFLALTREEAAKQQRMIYTCFKQAIEGKATSASLYAYLLLKNKVSIKWLDSLAQLADHQKDFRASDAIFHANPVFADQVFRQGLPRPSALCAIASGITLKPRDHTCKEGLFDEAIRFYGDAVPADALVNAAWVKQCLNKWEEAEVFYDKALAAYRDPIPVTVLVYAALTKLKLNKYQEEEVLWDKALAVFGETVPREVLANAALVKQRLYKWVEAEVLYDKTLVVYGDAIPACLLANAALIKRYLNKWMEAEMLYDKALVVYGETVPREVLINVAHVKRYLNKWVEAEAFYDKALVAYGDAVPREVLANAALVKQRLNKWVEAEAFYDKALVVLDDAIPAYVLANAADVKQRLNKWVESEVFYDKSLIAYGDTVPVEVLAHAALVKQCLNKWEEA